MSGSGVKEWVWQDPGDREQIALSTLARKKSICFLLSTPLATFPELMTYHRPEKCAGLSSRDHRSLKWALSCQSPHTVVIGHSWGAQLTGKKQGYTFIKPRNIPWDTESWASPGFLLMRNSSMRNDTVYLGCTSCLTLYLKTPRLHHFC